MSLSSIKIHIPAMSYNNLRRGRVSVSGQVYHVTAVTRNRLPVFGDLAAGRLLVRELMALDAGGFTTTLCFVVMPDHLHWLLALHSESLGSVLQRLKGRSSRVLGGGVWQANYHDHAMRRDEDLPSLARYIVANPLRAGLVTRIGDYPLWDATWLL